MGKNYFLIEFCFEIIVLSEGNTCIAQPNLEVEPFKSLVNETTQTLYWIGAISSNSNWVDSNIKGRPNRKMYIIK